MYKQRIIALVAALALLVPPVPTAMAVVTDGPTIIINELMWMGSSASSFDEWIELRNVTDLPVDISGWYLSRKSSGAEQLMLTLPPGATIEPHGYFVISNYSSSSASSSLIAQPQLVDTALSLANTQLHIKLYSAEGSLHDVADDGSGAPLAGMYVSDTQWASMERNYSVGDGASASSWHSATISVGFKTQTELGTPGTANSNSAPVADGGEDMAVTVNDIAAFDASNSSDAENDSLTYHWDFGDGTIGTGPTPTHSYEVTDSFTAVVTVDDGQLQATDSLIVTAEPRTTIVLGNEAKIPTFPGQEPDPGTANANAKIRLSEILPNPVGLDKEGEFIEIYNGEAQAILLTGWQLGVGSKVYTFPAISIAAQDYLTLGYHTTKLTLNNDEATVELKNPAQKVIDSVSYHDGAEGLSFARVADRWQWTAEITPGEENSISLSVSQSSSADAAVTIVSISEIAEQELRTKVTTRGIVSVAPGVFGSQYFYLFDGVAGIKIYSSKKDFPALAMGDEVAITGVVGEAEGERKINVATAQDITVVRHDQALIPLDLSIGDLSDSVVGSFVTVTGTLGNSAKTQFSLTDGPQTLAVVLKKNTGIGKQGVADGSSLSVAGIVGLKNNEVVLMPRVADDIVAGGVVLGEAKVKQLAVSPESTELLASSKGFDPIVWAVVVAVMIGGLGYWWYKKRAHPEGGAQSEKSWVNVKGDGPST